MATEHDVWSESFSAAADLSGSQFYGVYMSALDAVSVAGTANPAIGILQNKPTLGHAAQVRLLGISKAVCAAGTIAVGDQVGSGTAGTMVKKATADYASVGVAMDPSTAAGTIIRVMLTPGTIYRAVLG